MKKDINIILIYCSVVFIALAEIIICIGFWWWYDFEFLLYSLMHLGETLLLVVKVREKYENNASTPTDMHNENRNKQLTYGAIVSISVSLIFFTGLNWLYFLFVLLGGILLLIVEIKENKINKTAILNAINKYKNKDINKILTAISTASIVLAVICPLLHFPIHFQGFLFLLAGILLLIAKRRKANGSKTSDFSEISNYLD